MARIKYLKARGLWSHWDSEFEFGPGFTVITGPNGSGKSSAIRIIRWVGTGDFAGDDPIFKLTDDVTQEIIKQAEEGYAEIGLDNGVVITKTRRKGKTQYTHSDYAEPWEKAEVPQEIKDALEIYLSTFGEWETYLNFAFQLEAPFLISETPSVGAKVLGKLAGTEVVDLALAEISKRVFKARDEKRIAEKEIEKRNGDLLDYQDIDDVTQQLEVCNYLLTGVNTRAVRRDNIAQYSNTYDAMVEKVTSIEIELGDYSTLVLADELLQGLTDNQDRRDYLAQLYNIAMVNTATVTNLLMDLHGYSGIDEATALLPIVEQKSARLERLHGYSIDYKVLIPRIGQLALDLSEFKDIDVATADLGVAIRKNEKLEGLQNLDVAYRVAVTNISTADQTLLGYTGIDDANVQIASVITKQEQLDKLKDIAAQYTTRNAVASMATRELQQATDGLVAAQNEVASAWEAAGGICPLCDQPVAHTH